jgi:hypothetical protein
LRKDGRRHQHESGSQTRGYLRYHGTLLIESFAADRAAGESARQYSEAFLTFQHARLSIIAGQ